MNEKGEMMISKWEKARNQYERLKQAGKLSEIEDLPKEIEERAARVARKLFKKPRKPLTKCGTN